MISISAIVTSPPPPHRAKLRTEVPIRDRLRGPNISNPFVEEPTADISPPGPHSVATSVVLTTLPKGSNLSVEPTRTSGIPHRTIKDEVHHVPLRIALTLEATTVSRPAMAATVSRPAMAATVGRPADPSIKDPAGPSTLSSPAGPSTKDPAGLITASSKAKTTAEASVGAATLASLCHKSKTGTVNICSRCNSNRVATVARAEMVATEVSSKTGPPS